MAEKVFIVDDSLANRRILKAILKQDGYDLLEAEDGESAIDIALREKPDLILLDIMMPKKDGFEVCHALKSDERTFTIPIIFISAMTQESDKIKGLGLGAADYVTKPFSAAEVLARVRTQLKIYSLTKSLLEANRELEEKQRNLTLANTELKKLNEEKNKFVGMAAHDLRNPLIVIRGFSEFLIDQASPAEQDAALEMLATIKSSSEFMLALVNDLLDITKIESGTLELKPAPTDLVALIEHNIALNRILAEKREIDIVFNPGEKLPPSVRSILLDPQKIEQVLNNLIANAVKYSDHGSTVRVVLSMLDGAVLIQVQDHGQGIPEDEIDKLFRPFQTARTAKADGEKSTGLGLTIVRRLIEGHGGRVWVESEYGKGATFCISLPMP